MKTVKKFKKFNDLKSSESKTTEHALRLKKHTDFEKVIEEIRAAIVHKDHHNKPKP